MQREEAEAIHHGSPSALGNVDKKERLRDGRKGERWSQRDIWIGVKGRDKEEKEGAEDETGRHFEIK